MNVAAPNTDVSYYTNQLGTGAIVAIIVLSVAVWVVFLVAYIQIIRKAGYSGWWILIMLVPLVNVIMLLVFAFKEWPIQREIRELRAWADQVQHRGGAQPAAGGYGSSGYGQPAYGASGQGSSAGYGPGSSSPGQSSPGQSYPGQSYPGQSSQQGYGGSTQGDQWGTGSGDKR